MSCVKVVPGQPPSVLVIEPTADPIREDWRSVLRYSAKLCLAVIGAPCLIGAAFLSINLAPATTSFESSQWPWVCFFTFLNTSWFVVLPCALSNLFIDKPGCHRHDITVMVLCVFLNPVVFLAIPYALNVYPVFLFGYLTTTVLNVISRRLHFIDMGRADERDRPGEGVHLPASRILKLRSLASSALTLYLLVVVVCLICFNLVSSNAIVLQGIAGLVTGSVSVAARLAIPYVLFDRMKLVQIGDLHLDANIRAYYAFNLEVNSDVYFGLAFPNIENAAVFGFAMAVQMASIMLSTLWLFPRFADWMSANPNPQSPWSQVGILTKLGSRLLRPSKPSESEQSMYQWHRVARLIVFMRWLAKLAATLSFMTLYSLAFFSYNGKYLAFQPRNADQYWRVMTMSFISLICENIVLIGMSMASTFAFKTWDDPGNASFFVRGVQLLKSDSKAPFFVFATVFTNMAVSIGMFIQHTNWLYDLYTVH
ncbi:Uncharacterized protein PBTT_05790 [Plasmodiophora brassicae]